MATETELCNLALQRLGANPITTFGETSSKEGRACLKAFAPVRQSELRKYNWNFAILRASLAASVTAPAWGWTAFYPFPSDYLRLIEIDGLSARSDEFAIESGGIVCNETGALNVRYVADVTTVNSWDACFQDAFVAKLGTKMAETLTASESQKQSLIADYKTAISDARVADAIESPPDELPEDDWNLARR